MANNAGMTESEKAFKKWLDDRNYPYMYIEQSKETFSAFFRGISKRPDFLLIVKNFGIIAVDVKERRKSFTVDEKDEIEKYVEFERITRIPVWFVFCREKDYENWYWIPLSKVLNIDKKRSKIGYFRPIRESDCIIIQKAKGDGISRLIE